MRPESDRERQGSRFTFGRNDKGMAQAFNNLSHPPSFTLNQQAVGSTWIAGLYVLRTSRFFGVC